MGEPNNLLQRYFSDNERFADLVNTYVGRDILVASDLEEKDSQLNTRANKTRRQRSLSKQRDLIRKASMGMDFVLIGIEHQLSTHYAMPIRTLLYDGMGYEEQLKNISKLNRKKYALKGKELLSGFRKEDRVLPIFTLVIYYGQEPWDGAVDLYGLMDLQDVPEGIRNLIHNYPINLIQINTFEGVEKFKKDIKAVFGFLQNTCCKDRLEDFIKANYLDFENLDEEAYDVISHLTNARNLANLKQIYKKEGKINMCQAILDMIEDGKKAGWTEGRDEGRIEGKIEGRDEGIRIGLKNACLKMLKKSGNYKLVSEALEISIEQLKDWEAEENIHK